MITCLMVSVTLTGGDSVVLESSTASLRCSSWRPTTALFNTALPLTVFSLLFTTYKLYICHCVFNMHLSLKCFATSLQRFT